MNVTFKQLLTHFFSVPLYLLYLLFLVSSLPIFIIVGLYELGNRLNEID